MAVTDIVVIGASSLGMEAAWILDEMNRAAAGRWNFLGFVDVNKRGAVGSWGQVLGGDEWLAARRAALHAVCAIGDVRVRERVVALAERNPNIRFALLVAPGAHVAPDAAVGEGCIVFPGAVVSVGAALGRHTIVHGQCNVSHGCRIGEFCTLSPGSVLCGDVRVGRGTQVGAGATVVQGLSLGAGAVIGAGAAVLRDVPQGATWAGVPARPLHEGASQGARAPGGASPAA